MSLQAFRTFNKTIQRVRLLYDVTMHSYGIVFASGREQLKTPSTKPRYTEITLQGRVVKRPLKQITYQARDLYPEMLRSTLLIRLVSAYEAFLTDVLNDIASRTVTPFATDKRIDMSQSQLLSLSEAGKVRSHIIEKTMRQLTNGGLEDKRRFYSTALKVEILAPGQTLLELGEIHERRNIWVHREGYADAQYVHDFPNSGFAVGKRLLVSEDYLLRAMIVLQDSASHVRSQVQTQYPQLPDWRYESGDRAVTDQTEYLALVSARLPDPAALPKLVDLAMELQPGIPLRNIVVWVGTNEKKVKWLLAGSKVQVQPFFKHLNAVAALDEVRQIKTEKLKR